MRHIDADKLTQDLIDRSFYPAIVKSAIENAPTEDVVPRSEVARLQNILLQFTDIVHKWGNKNGIDTTEISLVPILEQEANSIIKQAKKEAAREILKEVRDAWANSWTESEFLEMLNELKKKYIGE